ncbi:MAG: hypothetical protein NTV86_15805, partial [Planctomycetota bacterium]|nr:hypothetical protein [Planctomycetota bacterium]
TDNSAVIGGGVYVAFPAPIGTGVYADEAGTAESDSSIIAANAASAGGIGPDVYGVITAARTLIGRGAGAKVYGSDNLVGHTTAGIDAKLDVRDPSGGGFYDLLPGSPAINAGTNPAGESTDTRGWPRLFGAKYDMGAVEHQAEIGSRIDVEIDNRDHVETYNFGNVPVGTSKVVVFTIRNEGTSILTINFVTRVNALLPTVFVLSPVNGALDTDDWQILPGATFTFTIAASPTLAIPNLLDTFVFGSDDPTRPIHALAVTVNQGPPVPDMQVGNVSIVEGNSGTKNVVFTVTLSSPSTSTVTAQYATSDGSATAGADYIAASGLVVFAPGRTSKTVTVKLKGDKIDELDESFFLDLSNTVGAAIAGQPPVVADPDDHTHQATATIIDDDPAPSVRINDVRVVEGNAGITNYVFTARLSGPSGKIVKVNYATADGTALAGSDYVAQSGTLTFVAGVVTQTVTIVVNGDITYEFDQTFFVNLSGPSNTTIADATGMGTIVNDDSAPTLTIDSPSILEGTGGGTFLDFTAALSVASERPVTALYATVMGAASPIFHPATLGGDFLPASGSLVFAPGETTKTIPVSIVADALNEFDEKFLLKLSRVTGATVGVGTGVATILDDDALPALSISDATVVEGNSGFRKMIFTVTLLPVSGRTVEVNYATSPNSASTPGDFITKTGTLSFAAGETTKTLFVLVRGDTPFEGNETFFVDLSAPTFATIADGHGVGTIVDDDI